MSISQRVRVFVDLGIQRAVRMRHVALCGLHRSTIQGHRKRWTGFETAIT